jgi:hypothetical protein
MLAFAVLLLIAGTLGDRFGRKKALMFGLVVFGAGSVLAAGAALPFAGRSTNLDSRTLNFRATLGLPEAPLASYATYVVDGNVDLSTGTGLVTSRVLAGHPDAHTEIGLPGLTRVVRVSTAHADGNFIRLRGAVEDRSQLYPGESPDAEIVIDRARRIVRAPFVGRTVSMVMA